MTRTSQLLQREVEQHQRSQEALRQSHEELRAIYDCMVDGLLIADVETLAFARANRAICQMLGYSSEELGSMSVLDIHPPEHLAEVLAAFHSQAAGTMVRAENLPVRRKDGRILWADISSNRISYQGRPCLIGFFRDVTERKRAEEQLKVNLRSQRAISSLLRRTLESISLDEQLENALVSLTSIPWLSLQAKGAIFVLDETTHELALRAKFGLPQEMAASCARVPLGHCLCGRSASTREVLFADCVDQRHETRYPGMLAHGHYCVPFVSNGQLLGVLTLYLEQGHKLDPDEIAFLATVGDVLAGLLNRNQLEQSLRKRDAELTGAKTIQETLLPGSPPNAPGFDIAGHCYPAEVAAGDHFDYLWLPDGSLLLVLADVSGHGLGPAMVAADFCARLRTLSETVGDLSEIAVRANAGLYKETTGEIFVTTILGRLDTNNRSMNCLNAGHPDAVVLNSAGEIKARFSSAGLPFAIVPEVHYPADEAVPLADGDLVLFYTDGLVEAHSTGQTLFGFDRAIEIVRANQHRPAAEIVELLYRSVCRYTGADKPKDDITVLVVKAI